MLRSFGIVAVLVLFLGCGGGGIAPAQQAVNTTARVLVDTDKYYSIIYENQRIYARQTSETWAERDSKMRGWDEVAELLRASYHWLAATEAAIDVWENTGNDAKFQTTTACLLKTCAGLIDGFNELGIKPLPALKVVSNLLQEVSTGYCTEP